MKKNCQRLYEYLEKNIDDQYYMAMRLYNEHSKIEGMPMFAWISLMYRQFWVKKPSSTPQSFMREGSEPIESRLELNEESLARYGFPSSAVGTNYAPLSISFTWRIVSGDNNKLLYRKNFMGESCNSDNYQEEADPRNVGKAVFQYLNEILRKTSTAHFVDGQRDFINQKDNAAKVLEDDTFFSFFFEKSLLPHSADHLKEDLSVNQKQQESEINITKIIKEKPHTTTTENGGENAEIF